MPQFLLSVHAVEGEPAPAPELVEAAYRDVDSLNEQLRSAGAWVFAGGLTAPEEATVVRMEGGEVTTSAGPFVAGPRRLGGFWIIEAADREAALTWAGKAAAACASPVEVRAFQDVPEA